MSRKGEAPSNTFLKVKKENSDLNQYWYSAKTIEALVKEIQECGAKRIAFLSTPSLYFSLTDEELKKNSYVFDVSYSISLQKVSSHFYLVLIDIFISFLISDIRLIYSCFLLFKLTFTPSFTSFLLPPFLPV